jgi:hypothetical protein
MTATTWWQILLAGMAGPIMVELAKAAKWHRLDVINNRWREPGYWMPFAAFLVLGGLLGLFSYGGDAHGVPVLRVAHLGATAPLAVSAWASTRTSPPRRKAGLIPDVDEAGRTSKKEKFANLVRW